MFLQCCSCNAAYSTSTPRWRCDCGSSLTLEGTGMFRPGQVAGRAASLWRYRESLGLDRPENAVTLGEGFTPLVKGTLDGIPVFFKLDYLGPTGSFKDRGCSVMVNKLLEWGVREIVEDSSGNAGAAVAAYTAAAGILANIYVPASTSAGKAAQIAVYGANLVKVPGTREETARAALDAAARIFYASHNWSPYFISGLKTLAFEVAEQLGWQAPDWIVVPVGGGGLALGICRGFRELREAGIVLRVPRLVAVQAEQCAPVYRAWKAGLDDVPPIEKGETSAEGIALAHPVKGREILRAIRACGGLARTVSEESIWETLAVLGRQGIYIEPTSAAAPAALAGLLADGVLSPGQSVVIVLTGIGLKATDKILQHMTPVRTGQ